MQTGFSLVPGGNACHNAAITLFSQPAQGKLAGRILLELRNSFVAPKGESKGNHNYSRELCSLSFTVQLLGLPDHFPPFRQVHPILLKSLCFQAALLDWKKK